MSTRITHYNKPLSSPNGTMTKRLRNFMNNWEVSGGSFSFDGYKVRLRVNGGGAQFPAPHPFQVTRADTDLGTFVKVRPGTINNLVPTNIFDSLAITATGVEYVVLTVNLDSTPSPTSAVLSIETDYPVPSATTPTHPPSVAKDVIAVLNDGVIFQVRDTNLIATSAEVFQETIDNPDPGERDYIPWYRWEISES